MFWLYIFGIYYWCYISLLFFREIGCEEDLGAMPKNSDGQPIEIKCDLFITAIDSFSQSAMEYSVSLYIRERWLDERLINMVLDSNETEITLDFDILEESEIWRPDLYFVNAKSGYLHDITSKNILMKISETGDVFFSMRYSLVLACDMDAHYYPMDLQKCDIIVESYAHNNSEVRLIWYEPGVTKFDGMSMTTFNLEEMTTTEWAYKYPGEGSGEHDRLLVVFDLQRGLGLSLIEIYFPSLMVVAISWLSFWIDPNATPARASLGVTVALTMTTLMVGARESLPQIGYATAIDVWMTVCLLFVFLSLLEFAAINYFLVLLDQDRRRRIALKVLDSKTPPPRTRWKQLIMKNNKSEPDLYNISMQVLKKQLTMKESEYDKYKDDELENVQGKAPISPKIVYLARYLDRISRVAFLVLFALFTLVYWITYGFLSGRI